MGENTLSSRQRTVCAVVLVVFSLLLCSGVLLADQFSSQVNAPTVPQLGALSPGANYGTDSFTGAFYYTFSFAVPPGTNGLTPSVELLYNSQSVQGSPSVVGSGWMITENYVQRDVNGTSLNSSDDEMFLTLNGRRYELVYSGSNVWHTKIESYLDIMNLSSGVTGRQYFRVRTTDGTTYAFGDSNESELVSNLYPYTVRWYLNQVTDAYSNRITYYYSKNPSVGDEGRTSNGDGTTEEDATTVNSNGQTVHSSWNGGQGHGSNGNGCVANCN